VRILHTVESYLPLKHGMSEVVRQLSERLVILGHDVTVATSFYSGRSVNVINGVNIMSFDIKGSLGEGIQGDVDEYIFFLSTQKFDVIVNFAAQQWASDICFELLPKLSAKKVFVPTGFSGLNLPAFSNYFENMKTWMNLYDQHVFLSNNYRDINFAKKNNVRNLLLIPNGAAENEFLKIKDDFNIRTHLGLPSSIKIILHVGSFTGFKGHDEALEIFLKSKQMNTALIFVGENFDFSEHGLFFAKKINWFRKFSFFSVFNRKSLKALLFFLKNFKSMYKKVFALKLTREQTIACYQQADLFLFPSLIECSPIVLFESLASKTPFLVTDVGNSKEIIEWTHGGDLLPTTIGKDGLSRANIEESAVMLRDLLADFDRMENFKRSGFSSWLDRFTWEKITFQYEEMYKRLLN
jgi:glycosyltransferase involved in cell wall biosynthesis